MKARVLIIGDDAPYAALHALRGKVHGFEVELLHATNASSALSMAKAGGVEVSVVGVGFAGEARAELLAGLTATAPLSEIVVLAHDGERCTGLAATVFACLPESPCGELLSSTLRQALEKVALKHEREEYARRVGVLVDATEVLIVGVDAHGTINLCNRRLATLVGVSEVEVLGTRFAERFVHDPDQKKFHHAVAMTLAGERSVEVHVGVRDSASAVRRVRWNMSAVLGGDNRTAAVYGIGIDVTERRALERRAADAEALNAMAPLALGLAHEIRNPLNAAVLELHLLGRGIERLSAASVREPMKRRVGIVEGEIKRLERLLTDFLELARPRAPQREPVDLARVVGDVLELEAEAIAGHHVEVVRVVDQDCFALGDVEKLKQVALNLVVNSLDAMPDGGKLRATVGGDVNEVWMSIADSGPGIEPTILAEIFDAFFTTKAAGTGLGLAIVRKIVDQHQGRVVVDTKKGEGTTVRAVFPRLLARELG